MISGEFAIRIESIAVELLNRLMKKWVCLDNHVEIDILCNGWNSVIIECHFGFLITIVQVTCFIMTMDKKKLVLAILNKED